MERLGLSCFDADASVFATVSNDNRLKIWNVATGELKHTFTEANHLATQYTSIAITNVAKQAAKKKGRKSSKNAAASESSTFVAVGTKSGEVLLWDLKLGEVVKRLQSHDQAVTDVAFSNDGTAVFAASVDKTVVRWDTLSGAEMGTVKTGKHPVQRIAIGASGDDLLTASATLKLYDVASSESKKDLSGHSSNVSCLAYSSDSQFAVSGASDRNLFLWDLSADGPSKPIHTLTMDSKPLEVRFEKLKGKHAYAVVAVSQNSVLSVWRWDASTIADAKASKASPPVTQVRVGKKVAKSEGVIQNFYIQNEANQILLARGTALKPVFERVNVVDPVTGKPTSTISLQSIMSRLMETHTAVKRKATDPTELTVASGSEVKSKHVKLLEGVIGDEKMDTEAVDAVPQAGSLQVILSQSLRSSDETLLEYCLSNTNTLVIEKTVDRLPGRDVLPLLNIVITKFASSPNRGPQLLVWIQEILSRHTPFLMSLPNLSDVLAPLYQTVDSRLSVFKKLFTLSGRLDLLLSQVNMRNRRTDDSFEDNNTVPVTEYVESDDEEDEDEEGSNDGEEESEDSDNDMSIEEGEDSSDE